MHYQRWKDGRDLLGPANGRPTVEDRLRQYTVTPTGCHLWDGFVGHDGYGVMKVQKRIRTVIA
jgi:hypothetical protein